MSGILIARRSSAGKRLIVLPAIGDPFMGGYYVGIIDTTKGNIIAADASQAGLRYALIVAPKSLQATSLAYKTSDTAAPTAALTRWDGLTVTQAMTGTTYPAANYCNGLSYPADGGSQWYLAAMDEWELVYRNLKPTTDANATGTKTATFPASQPNGYNPSSDPSGAAYTSTVPAQTTVTAFKSGGAEELGSANEWFRTATESVTANAWVQYAINGNQPSTLAKSLVTSDTRVRPVRRVAL